MLIQAGVELRMRVCKELQPNLVFFWRACKDLQNFLGKLGLQFISKESELILKATPYFV